MLSKRGKDKGARGKDQSRRLYLAFHHRNPNADDPSPLSYSILLTDKSPAPEANTSTRYRVAREQSLTDDIGLIEWAFIAQGALSTRSVRALGLMLLGKVGLEISPQEIERMLATVKVDQTELVWSASPWMVGALSVCPLSSNRCLLSLEAHSAVAHSGPVVPFSIIGSTAGWPDARRNGSKNHSGQRIQLCTRTWLSTWSFCGPHV